MVYGMYFDQVRSGSLFGDKANLSKRVNRRSRDDLRQTAKLPEAPLQSRIVECNGDSECSDIFRLPLLSSSCYRLFAK